MSAQQSREPVEGAELSVVTTGMLVADRYRLSGRIGRGASADVYGARDEVLQRPVAVKVFRFDTAVGEDRRRVEAEVRLLASLHHPGLVTVHDAGTLGHPDTAPDEATEGTPYLVMELINGPTLSQRLDEGPLTETEAAQFGLEVAATLAYIHGAGVVHRDIKPANILLDAPSAVTRSKFSAKLTDFGIARMLDSTRLTMDGLTIGTANYLSPEQAQGQQTGPAADIYSLGLVLIQCLTGQLAFPGVGFEAALARLQRQPEIPQAHGPAWATVLTAMTARDPEQRPAAAYLVPAFSELLQGASSPAGLPSASSPAGLPDAFSAAVLPGASSATASTAAFAPAAAGDTELGGPGRAGPVRVARRRALLAAAGALLVALLVVAGIALISRSSGAKPSGTVPPSPYPSVSGQLGRDLQQLQGTVG